MTFLTAGAVPVARNLADNSKGSIGNRLECGASQTINTAKTCLASAGVVGSAVLLSKNPQATSQLAQGAKGLAKTLGKFAEPAVRKFAKTSVGNKLLKGLYKALSSPTASKIEDIASKAYKATGSWVKANPKLAALSAVALLVIGAKHFFSSGQIDQKYTDRAALQGKLDE